MQLKSFAIPVHDPEEAEKAVNAYLRGRRVLEVVQEFVQAGAGSHWCVLVKAMEGSAQRPDRIDYKSVLDEAAFARFCALRKARKTVAEMEGVPAFAIFTDKQMATWTTWRCGERTGTP